MLTIRSRAYVVPALLFLGAAFALAIGLGYNCGNLRQYLLHGLHTIDPRFLANDWFTTQTRAHHAAFNAALVLAGKLTRLDATFAVANAAFAVIFVCCVHALAARLYRTPIVVTAITVFIVALAPRSMIGWSAIMTSYFQPSTIGAIGLMAGLTCLIYERHRAAGLIFFVSTLFHINYMVWTVVIVGVVVLTNFHCIGITRALHVVVPIALAVLYHLPFVIEGRSPEQLTHSTAAARILHDIYMPFHSRPSTWDTEQFARFAAMLAAGGVAMIVVRPHRRVGRIALSALGAIAGILVVGMLLTIAVRVDTVALLFPYRLAPILLLVAEIAVAGAIATTAQSANHSLPKTVACWGLLAALLHCGGVSAYGLLCLAGLVVAILAGRLAQDHAVSVRKMLLVLVGLIAVLGAAGAGNSTLTYAGVFVLAGLAWRLVGQTRISGASWARLFLLGRAALPLVVAAFVMRLGSVRKDFLGPQPPADERLLYDWCRARTDRGDVFIIPPVLGGFRLGAERAVVVDWKCMPILPRNTVEWYRRLADVCGTEFDTLGQAGAGYLKVDAPMARRLGRDYMARYLVTYRNDHEGDLGILPRVYSNPTFAVFDLREPRWTDTPVVITRAHCQ
ncbi:MAG: hypothetical protein JXQ75_13330 [Phycisphaerae bacterium]|nr:hypothetical protein [Phycisphaerae bacterium]